VVSGKEPLLIVGAISRADKAGSEADFLLWTGNAHV